MRRAVRAIIINDDQLLVMHRNKFGKEYDTLPGGNIEIGESPEQALVREIMEETTLKFADPKLVIIEHAGLPWGDQLIYRCDYLGGDPHLQEGSEEDLINRLKNNLYEPMWLKLSDLTSRPFVSEKLKNVLLNAVQLGWSENVIEI
ncbi:MAG: hypothetical protein NVSMB46_03050 [Candidatus Saccharimonadales bacterium]